MQLEDCYFLGTITRKHGLKGHVLLKLDTDEPEKYYKMESLLIELNGGLVPFFIKEITPIQEDIVKLIFQESTFSIESLLQKKTYLPLSQLPKLEGTKFYFYEVIGFQLYDNKTFIGTIKEILDNTAQSLFVIEYNEKQIVIPIIDSWIKLVNRIEKIIVMELPEGITDL